MPAAHSESRAGAIQCFFASMTMDSLAIRFSLMGMVLPSVADVIPVCRIGEFQLPSAWSGGGELPPPVGRAGARR